MNFCPIHKNFQSCMDFLLEARTSSHLVKLTVKVNFFREFLSNLHESLKLYGFSVSQLPALARQIFQRLVHC